MASDSFEIVMSPGKGRSVVASRVILPGECLLRSKVFCAAVTESSKARVCSNCFRTLKEAGTQSKNSRMPFKCEVCNEVFYCSKLCLQEGLLRSHSEFECFCLKRIKSKKYKNFTWIQYSSLRLILNALSLTYIAAKKKKKGGSSTLNPTEQRTEKKKKKGKRKGKKHKKENKLSAEEQEKTETTGEEKTTELAIEKNQDEEKGKEDVANSSETKEKEEKNGTEQQIASKDSKKETEKEEKKKEEEKEKEKDAEGKIAVANN